MPPPPVPRQTSSSLHLRQYRPPPDHMRGGAFFSDAESRVTDWVLSQQQQQQQKRPRGQGRGREEEAMLERPEPEVAMASLEVDR